MPLERDIDRPLGQTRIKRRSWLGEMPKRAPLLSGIAAVAVVMGSGLIANRERPYRVPAQTVEIIPVEQSALPPVTTLEPDVLEPDSEEVQAPQSPDGPAIIKVKPEQRPGAGVVVIRDPAELAQNSRVAHLPDRALIEQTPDGPLPVRSVDGRRPFDVYAGAWSGTRGARVAIVIGGLGLSQTGTQEAIAKLPSPVTLAFASQGNSIGRWMQTARREGHEILMQVPMEPFDYPRVNPGRNTLTVDEGAAQDMGNLRFALGRTTNYTGIMNHMGGRYLSDASAVSPLMKELGKRGLMFVDDGTSARSIAPEMAPPNRVPIAVGDEVIDAVRSRGEILKKLDELEATARARGYAIGTGSAFPETVDAIAGWIKEARRRGIEIVPVSAVAADPERN